MRFFSLNFLSIIAFWENMPLTPELPTLFIMLWYFLGTAFQEMFGEEIKKITISPQLTLVVSQYLTTNIEPFKVQFMSEIVLKRLLTMNVYREIKIKKDSEGNQQKQEEKELIIMTKGKPIDYFVLIIEGKLLTY